MPCERLICPKCNADFGQEVKFLNHLSSIHGIDDHSAFYVELFHNGTWPTCRCEDSCLQKLKFVSWKKGFISKYVRGHNAKIDSVYLNSDRQTEFAKKRSQGYSSGKYAVWNAGLTKENSEKLAKVSEKISSSLKQGYASGTIVDWHKLDPFKAGAAAKKASKKKKELYAAGNLIPWNKGMTKYDDPRVAAMSFGIKENYKENPDASARRLTCEEFVERVKKIPTLKLLSDPLAYKNKYQKFEFECIQCGSKQVKSLMMLENCPVCFFCRPKESKGQIEVFDFIKKLASDVVMSDRTEISPKEIDVFVPSKKFGIEYNGLYWHSGAVMTDPRYHQNKHAACEKANIKLFSIYEDEWRDRRSIIEGMIRHRLKSPIKKWDARKLEIVTLNKHESRDFFDSNHLEGHASALVVFALRDKTSNKVLAALSLRKPFHRKYKEYLEVARCCTLAGHSVRGWLGRLTSIAKKHAVSVGVEKLITYVDARVGTGRGYSSSGWTLENDDTSPRFWWTDFFRRYNRFKYRADALRNMSQIEVASEAGVFPIWGCSNFLYKIDLKI